MLERKFGRRLAFGELIFGMLCRNPFLLVDANTTTSCLHHLVLLVLLEQRKLYGLRDFRTFVLGSNEWPTY
jgi:hypothetical protein